MLQDGENYTVRKLSDRLFLIAWLSSPMPNSPDLKTFPDALKDILETATQQVYFLSDLRRGQISDIRTLQQMSDLTRHPKWGGSTAFSEGATSSMLVSTFVRMSQTTGGRNKQHRELAQAIAFLESLEPGLTTDIDWDTALETEAE